VDRNERMDAEIKKTIDGRTKEFKEKLAKLAYEKVKAILSPDAEPLKGKGYPYQEEVEVEASQELEENKIFFVKVGTGRDHMIVKTKANNKSEAMKKLKAQFPGKQVSLDRNSEQGKAAGAFEDVNEQEITLSLDESVLVEKLRLRNPNKLATIDIDYIGSSSDINQSQREYNIKIKKTGRQMADVTGKKGDIVKFLQGDAYAMDDEDIEEIFPELLEGVKDVENMFGLRAADWRKLVKKHARHIDAFQRGRKDLPKNVEDELLTWAMDNGEVKNKDDAEDFIDIVLNASYEIDGDTIQESILTELKARYDVSDMRSSKDPKVKREFKKLEKVQYGSLQYIRQYKEVEKALDDSLPAHKRKK
jgi:hypothetical protein